MAKSNNRGSRNNNPTGRNQYSDRGVMEMVKERPIAAAATAAGAAAAGLFLWSKRSQISDQLSNLSDQIGEWTGNMSSGSRSDGMAQDSGNLPTNVAASRGMSETGAGNANLGRTTGGAGSTGPVSGRGRAKSQPTT